MFGDPDSPITEGADVCSRWAASRSLTSVFDRATDNGGTMNTCALGTAANDAARRRSDTMRSGSPSWPPRSGQARSAAAELLTELLDAPVSNNSLAGGSGHVRKNSVVPRPAPNVLSSSILPTTNELAAEVDRVLERVETPDQELHTSGRSSKKAMTALQALEAHVARDACSRQRPTNRTAIWSPKSRENETGQSLSQCLTY